MPCDKRRETIFICVRCERERARTHKTAVWIENKSCIAPIAFQGPWNGVHNVFFISFHLLVVSYPLFTHITAQSKFNSVRMWRLCAWQCGTHSHYVLIAVRLVLCEWDGGLPYACTMHTQHFAFFFFLFYFFRYLKCNMYKSVDRVCLRRTVKSNGSTCACAVFVIISVHLYDTLLWLCFPFHVPRRCHQWKLWAKRDDNSEFKILMHAHRRQCESRHRM